MFATSTGPHAELPAFFDVAVLAGGVSAERAVSLASGRAVQAALCQFGHFATLFDPAEIDLEDIAWRNFDVGFICLHGGAGENGRVQLQLEEIGVPYTGSQPLACRLAMSKIAAKERFARRGLATPESISLRAGDPTPQLLQQVARFGFPAVIKPDSQGSSLGVGLVAAPDDVPDAIANAKRFESVLLAERYVPGRELTVTLLDEQPLPVLQIEPERALFDYENKCTPQPGSIRALDESDPVSVAAQTLAVEAARALGTRGLVRVDLIADEATGELWLLEVNAVPGMTARSLAPLAARHAGIDMSMLCDALARAALATEVHA